MKRDGLLWLIGGVMLFMTLKTYAAPKQAEKYVELFKFVESESGIPVGLLTRLAQQESFFNASATNPSGAQGLMQLIPKFHPGVDPFKPEEAIPYAAKFLRAQFERFGSWRAALAAYNWGPGNVNAALRKHAGSIDEMLRDTELVPKETRNYVTQITADVPVA